MKKVKAILEVTYDIPEHDVEDKKDAIEFAKSLLLQQIDCKYVALDDIKAKII